MFVLIRLEIEITRDLAQGFISDSFDKFPGNVPVDVELEGAALLALSR